MISDHDMTIQVGIELNKLWEAKANNLPVQSSD